MPPSRAFGSRRAPVGAAVDVGAYSVHLLIAEVHGHRLVPLVDESVTLGLGTIVDQRGELGFLAGMRLLETLERYADTARSLAATSIAFVATDPLRRAGDAKTIIEVVAARTGIETEVLEHDEEALLALLGVQAGHPIRRDTVLVDVGGGSSEILVVAPGADPVAVGLPLGAARLSRSVGASDPPSRAQIEALVDEARAVLVDAPDATPSDLVAVGGTASNLLRVGPPLVRRVLTVRRMESALELLAGAPADAIAAQFSVKPSRARVLPGGLAILLGVAERYGRDHIRVSTDGLREGLVLASMHGGPRWRENLAWLAHGWSI